MFNFHFFSISKSDVVEILQLDRIYYFDSLLTRPHPRRTLFTLNVVRNISSKGAECVMSFLSLIVHSIHCLLHSNCVVSFWTYAE